MFKKIPRPVADTQICLIALGYPHSTSYAKACEDLLGIKLDKRKQFMDWRKRPLDSKEILYALNDVRYLIPLFKKISSMLDIYKKKNSENIIKKLHMRKFLQKELKLHGKRLNLIQKIIMSKIN